MVNFLEGNVKLTFNQREPRDGNDCVKFNEIISGPWNFILLSSYCTDFNWLLDQFNGIAPGTAINLIEHYDRISDPAGIKKISLANNSSSLKRELYLIHPKFPKFPNYGVMHCKLMILATDDFLRIVVSSANLMDYDYNEVQNIVFIQDLPRLKETSLTASNVSILNDCQFYSALNRLLESLGVFNIEKVIMPMDLMQKYDWTGMNAQLVYSIPGYFSTTDVNVSGISMLNEIVKEQFKDELVDNFLTIEYQGSSLGAIKREWLVEFGEAASGNLNYLDNFNDKKRLFKNTETKKPQNENENENLIDLTLTDSDEGDENENIKLFKIIFPTVETVKQSSVGIEGFGTIFCKKKDFISPSLPKEILTFYNCTTNPKGSRCKYAMHSKIMTVSSSKKIAYVYCGSHNFTASAWGKSTKKGSMLMISNFEVGVVLIKEPKICYPYVRPAEKYKATDFPWDQTDTDFN